MKSVKQGESVASYQLKNGWRLKKQFMETPSGVSQTIPDTSYSIRDLIKKYAGGIDPAVSKLSNYDGEDEEIDFDDPDLANIARADIAEAEELRRQASARLALLEQMAKKERDSAPLKGSKKYEPKEVEADDLDEGQEEENTSKRRKGKEPKIERSED